MIRQPWNNKTSYFTFLITTKTVLSFEGSFYICISRRVTKFRFVAGNMAHYILVGERKLCVYVIVGVSVCVFCNASKLDIPTEATT